MTAYIKLRFVQAFFILSPPIVASNIPSAKNRVSLHKSRIANILVLIGNKFNPIKVKNVNPHISLFFFFKIKSQIGEIAKIINRANKNHKCPHTFNLGCKNIDRKYPNENSTLSTIKLDTKTLGMINKILKAKYGSNNLQAFFLIKSVYFFPFNPFL